MDQIPTIWIAAGLGAVSLLGLILAIFSGGSGDVRKRIGAQNAPAAMRGVKSRSEQGRAAQADVAQRLKEIQAEKGKISLRLRLEQAGLSSGPVQFMMIFQVMGLAGGVGAYVLTGQPLAGLGLAGALAFGLPRTVLKKLIERRVNKFTAGFAGAVDILIRGVKSGLPVGEGIKIIATEAAEPVRTEFKRVVDATALGVPIDESLQRMADRVPTQDVNFFRTVLAIQKQTGGNLAEALGNLSETLRERHKLKLKVKTLTAEARVSAIVLGCLPLVVGGAVYLLRPDYIGVLFEDPFGQTMLMGAAGWMFLGVLALRAMVKIQP